MRFLTPGQCFCFAQEMRLSTIWPLYLSTFWNSEQYLSAQNWALFLNSGRSEHLGLSTFLEFSQNWAPRFEQYLGNTHWLSTYLDFSHNWALWTEHFLRFYKIWAPWTEHIFAFSNIWALISEHFSQLKKWSEHFILQKNRYLSKKNTLWGGGICVVVNWCS